ncbi:MAG: hypothetical protein PHV74_06785 [Dehalococcoidia bacterium]|nr:hypothetical protein [Dehalococcoidia bacterium]
MSKRQSFVLTGIMGFGIILRCIFLLLNNPPLLGADSYWFHYLATQAINGEHVDYLHTGMVWPLVQMDKVLPLDVSIYVLPILIYLATASCLFYLAYKMFGSHVALWSVAAWTVIRQSVYFTEAKYIDRDGLTALLVVVGVMTAYLGARYVRRWWQFALVGIYVALIGHLIFLEWCYAGRWLLMLAVFGVFESMMMPLKTPVKVWLRDNRGVLTSLAAFMVVSGILILIFDLHDWDRPWMPNPFNGFEGTQDYFPVSELQPISLGDLLFGWYPALPFAIMGIVIVIRRRTRADLVILAWFLTLFAASFMAVRCINVAFPAIGILAGIWLSKTDLDIRYNHRFHTVMIGGLIVMSGLGGWLITAGDIEGLSPRYMGAMEFLREETPTSAKVLEFYDKGNKILDIGERWPVRVGCWTGDYPQFLSSDVDTMICRAYMTDDPEEVAEVMRFLGTDYFILSEYESDEKKRDMIMDVAFDRKDWTDKEREAVWRASVMRQFRDGELANAGSLEAVFRDGSGNKRLVIVHLVGVL